MRFEQVKHEIVLAVYDLIRNSDGQIYFRPSEIQQKMNLPVGIAFVHRACESLSESEFLEEINYDGEPHFGLTDEGINTAEERYSFEDLTDEQIPASDRLVSLKHNSPDYMEIAEGLEEAIVSAEAARPNEVGGDEHATLIAGLKGARELWRSFELTKMQYAVGVILALEKAEKELRISFQMARGALLVEAVKAFFKAAMKSDIF